MKANFNEVIRVQLDFTDDLRPIVSIMEFLRFTTDNKIEPLTGFSATPSKIDAIFYKRDADRIWNWLKELEGSDERK